jgi:hypothetical protein
MCSPKKVFRSVPSLDPQVPESATIRAAAALMSAEIVSAAEDHLALGSSLYALPGSAISLPFLSATRPIFDDRPGLQLTEKPKHNYRNRGSNNAAMHTATVTKPSNFSRSACCPRHSPSPDSSSANSDSYRLVIRHGRRTRSPRALRLLDSVPQSGQRMFVCGPTVSTVLSRTKLKRCPNGADSSNKPVNIIIRSLAAWPADRTLSVITLGSATSGSSTYRCPRRSLSFKASNCNRAAGMRP